MHCVACERGEVSNRTYTIESCFVTCDAVEIAIIHHAIIISGTTDTTLGEMNSSPREEVEHHGLIYLGYLAFLCYMLL